MSKPPSRRAAKRAARKERRAARAQAASTLMPPEGVPIHLPVAGLGVRTGAQIADVLFTMGVAISVTVFLAATDIASGNTVFAVFMLLFFIARVPYYVFAELAWNGQTLGKKWMKIKVVSHDGGPLSTHALVLRNLMKEAEVFLPGTLLFSLDAGNPVAALTGLGWIAMALAIPLTNPHRRRLGDIMAGTHVVHLPHPMLLKDIATDQSPPVTKKAKERFAFLPHQLDHYGAFELQTLEQVLRAEGRTSSPAAHTRQRETLLAIVDKIRNKISYPDPIPEADAASFLRAFYVAQRAYLEQRQIFGDRREDKHHAQDDENAGK